MEPIPGSQAPSSVALSLMKKLADAPPMICVSWKKIPVALSKTQSDLRAISTLLEWLKDSLQEEKTHWDIIDSFGHRLTLDKLATVDFSQILASICILSGADAGETPPIEAMQECFMDLALDCMALQSMQERLKDSFLGRPIHRGGPTTLDRFKQRWQSVIQELEPEKIGAPMREYLGMLGRGLAPMTEDSGLHVETSTSEGAGFNGAGSKC